MSSQIICVSCKAKLRKNNFEFGILKCDNCESEYYIINKIPVILDDNGDFYRYKKIFKRMIKLKK